MYNNFFNFISNCKSNRINEANLPSFQFCTDSRNIIKDSWFIALKGANFDGHDFCQMAIDNGIKGLIINDNFDIQTLKNTNNLSIIQVQNTLKTYQEIANYYRKHLKNKTKFIAITGSNGKTTTKEILYLVLKQKYKTQCSLSNENNEIGVPKNILNINENTQIFIAECGMRGLNQIQELVEIIEPDYTAITNIGNSHIGILGSREKIAQAKSEIFRFAPADSLAFIPANEDLLEKWTNLENNNKKINIKYFDFSKVQNIEFKNNFLYFTYHNYQFSLASSNLTTIYNACLVIEIALELNLNYTEIQKGLAEYKPSSGRGALIELKSGVQIIDETYNASPDSVVALAKSLNYLGKNKQKVLILGEIAELGSSGEELLISMQADLLKNLDHIILIGKGNYNLAKNLDQKAHYFNEKKEALDFLKENNYLNENYLLGFKASRISKLEEMINDLQKILS